MAFAIVFRVMNDSDSLETLQKWPIENVIPQKSCREAS